MCINGEIMLYSPIEEVHVWCNKDFQLMESGLQLNESLN